MRKAIHDINTKRKAFVPTPLLIILLGTLILRIPNLFEPYWYGDEAIYLAVGEGLRQGLLLYRDIFDHKTPLIYLLAAIGGSIIWFKFILIVWHQATLFIFWKFTEKLFVRSSIEEKDIPKAVALSTVLFALLTTLPALEGNLVNSEILMILPTLLGFYLLWEEKISIKTLLLSGLIFSIGFLLKVPALFDVLAIIAYWGMISLWDIKKIGNTIGKSFLIGVGLLIPVVVMTLYFVSKNALSYYIQGIIGINLNYVTSWATPQVGGEKGGLVFRAEILAGIFLILLLVKRFFDKTTLFLTIWFSLSMFAMLLSGRPYPHYLIQAVTPLALILGNLVFGSQRYRFLPLPTVGIFLLSLMFYQFYYYPVYPYYKNFVRYTFGQESWESYINNFDSRMSDTYSVAQYLVEHTQAKERVFIWGTEPELYALSRHVPPGRFITSFHIVDFNAQEETMRSLEDNQPQYILVSKNETRKLEGFDKFLNTNYLYVQTIGNLEIWKKVDTILMP